MVDWKAEERIQSYMFWRRYRDTIKRFQRGDVTGYIKWLRHSDRFVVGSGFAVLRNNITKKYEVRKVNAIAIPNITNNSFETRYTLDQIPLAVVDTKSEALKVAKTMTMSL